MSLRKSISIVPILLAAVLSSPLALAAGDEPAPPKPKCTSQQVWNPKTNKCDPLVSSRASDDDRAYSLADAIAHPVQG